MISEPVGMRFECTMTNAFICDLRAQTKLWKTGLIRGAIQRLSF